MYLSHTFVSFILKHNTTYANTSQYQPMRFKVKLRIFICKYFISLFSSNNDLQTHNHPLRFTHQCSRAPSGPSGLRTSLEALPRRAGVFHAQGPPSREPPSSPDTAWTPPPPRSPPMPGCLGAQCVSGGTVGMSGVMATEHTRLPERRRTSSASITAVAAASGD